MTSIDLSGLPTDQKPTLAVIMTAFNRKAKTLAALQALASNVELDDVDLTVVLVDDGSTDGTAEAVAQAFPWVQVTHGDGSLFWCRGMHRAFELAMHSGYDYYLWLNDDTILYPDAVSRMIRCHVDIYKRLAKQVIVVGSTVDDQTGKLTYGGELRPSRWRPTTLTRVVPGDVAQKCDSMNGNFVLIPAEAAKKVGNLDPAFEHAMGDTDYALRAGRVGVDLWVAPGVFGTCGHNSVAGTYLDTSLSFSRRWKHFLSRKGLPWRSWMIFTRRHAGPAWLLFFAVPYVKQFVRGLLQPLTLKK
ncbi:MAG: glycosyltransferase family 2 protein [Sulfuriferula multivorans]|uniref:Glycosyltransferase family 2 protein n=1 Tax=Sulfuriferula multivorans TaxID=1559896 RepID=A0A7C9KY11_9PROT|nr:glycosyltransferase family 2 protein [Sulfuriferula multivorans]